MRGDFEERTMEEIGRRAALALGLAATAAPALVSPRPVMAQAYGPNEGKEVAPGVRVVELGEREAIIPGYKTVKMIDVVFQPGSHAPEEAMEHDMVCHMFEGELRIRQNGKEFRVKKGDVYTCAKGTTEEDWNEGDVVAVMRVTELMAA
jgi:quercetin dioxygenase-like cupin family protein